MVRLAHSPCPCMSLCEKGKVVWEKATLSFLPRVTRTDSWCECDAALIHTVLRKSDRKRDNLFIMREWRASWPPVTIWRHFQWRLGKKLSTPLPLKKRRGRGRGDEKKTILDVMLRLKSSFFLKGMTGLMMMMLSWYT